jgi:lysophospholipase L1-like esterase
MSEHDSTRSATVAFACAVVLLSACSGDPDEPEPGSGGTAGVAGSAGTAGNVAGAGAGNAGAGGQGGSAGSAGSVSSGGAAAAAGAGMGGAGMAGASGSAGAAGTMAGGGGASGSAGSAGSAGASGGGQGGASGASGAAGGGAGGQAGGGASGAADSAGAAGSAGSGGGGFQPCPATGACVILPLGDSITDGVGMNGGGGYRIELFSLATADGHEITYVGSLQNGPQMVDGMTFPRRHEGHSGWKIAQLNPLIPSTAFNPMTPHIVLLHIGTNDIAQNDNLSQAPARLEALIDLVIEEAPDALIAVAQVIPLNFGAGGSAVDTYNDAIPDIVEERASAGKHVILVDQNTDFPLSELPDNVHPDAAGYERMARKWYDAIEPYLR